MKTMNGFKPLTIFKDLIDGVKTDDDRLAKKLLNNIDKITDIKRGFGTIDISVNFKYGDYSFQIMDGYGKMYIPYKVDEIRIKSKFLSKLLSRLKSAIDREDTIQRLKKAKAYAALRSSEFTEAINQHGGISKIAETILIKIQPVSFWKGEIRLDNCNELVMLTPTNTTDEARKEFNTLIVNLHTGETRLEKSYAAFADHKRYDGILNYHEIESLQKYVQLAKDTAKMKDDEKATAINNLINLA